MNRSNLNLLIIVLVVVALWPLLGIAFRFLLYLILFCIGVRIVMWLYLLIVGLISAKKSVVKTEIRYPGQTTEYWNGDDSIDEQ